MISLCGFDLHFSVSNDVEHLFICLLPVQARLLWRNVFSNPLTILKLGCLIFVVLLCFSIYFY